MKKIITSSLIALSCLVCFSNSVFASDAKEIQQLQAAKISLVQAIQIAETALAGKAISASIDDDYSTPTFEIEIIKDGKKYDVLVDGITSKIISQKEDLDD